MSVKMMTTDQIRNDLEAIAMTWPSEVPWQQVDRVNALRGELKRRGEPLERPLDQPATKPFGALNAMSVGELETELRAMSDRFGRDPKDEAAQKRFADVRYELRQRAKAGPESGLAPRQPALPPRDLELPDDDEMPAKKRGVAATPMPIVSTPELLDELGLTRKPAQSAPAPKNSAHRFSASDDGDGSVTLAYEHGSRATLANFRWRLSIGAVDALVAELLVARGGAAASVTKSSDDD